uniref:Uncharacterized protein n=1 Tax=Trichogramma kaykai TaxID=54128 RepID=A0ABD2WHU0_9HYME
MHHSSSYTVTPVVRRVHLNLLNCFWSNARALNSSPQERRDRGLAAKRGDLNLPVNEDGLTALHVVCDRECDEVSAKMVFEICKDHGLQTIHLDAWVRWKVEKRRESESSRGQRIFGCTHDMRRRQGREQVGNDALGGIAYDAANHRRQPVQIDALDNLCQTTFNLLCSPATSERWNCYRETAQIRIWLAVSRMDLLLCTS